MVHARYRSCAADRTEWPGGQAGPAPSTDRTDRPAEPPTSLQRDGSSFRTWRSIPRITRSPRGPADRVYRCRCPPARCRRERTLAPRARNQREDLLGLCARSMGVYIRARRARGINSRLSPNPSPFPYRCTQGWESSHRVPGRDWRSTHSYDSQCLKRSGDPPVAGQEEFLVLGRRDQVHGAVTDRGKMVIDPCGALAFVQPLKASIMVSQSTSKR